MEVILLERVAKLGQMGEVVKVRDGFARNFLLKRGKALRATAENRARYDGMKADLEANNIKAKGEAGKVAEKINGKEIVIIRQAAESGQLFGSVSVRDIVDALAADGITVSRTQVWLDSPIKVIGQKKVTIAVHPEVETSISVTVARSAEAALACAAAGLVVIVAISGDDLAQARLHAELRASGDALVEPPSGLDTVLARLEELGALPAGESR